MPGSRKPTRLTPAATIVAVASSTLLLVVVVLVSYNGTSGGGNGDQAGLHPSPPGWSDDGGGFDGGGGGGGASSPPGQRRHLLESTDELHSGSLEDFAAAGSAAVAAAVAAAAAGVRTWMRPRDDAKGWGVLVGAPTTRTGGVGGSGTAESRTSNVWRRGLESGSEYGLASSALNAPPPAHAPGVSHDAAPEEAGRAWRTDEGDEEWRVRKKETEADGSVPGSGGDSRLRGVRRRRQHQQRRHRWLSVVEDQAAEDERYEAPDIAAVVAGEEDFWYEGGVLEGEVSRSLRAVEFDHVPDRCFREGERSRCHPNIFLFGVSKCGTTSLAHWMKEHPKLQWVTHPGKPDKIGAEAHVMEIMGRKDSASAFDRTAPEAKETDPVIDYTPHYSILADVPYRILHVYGKQAYDGTVKYLVILREPAARTISSWQFKYDLSGAEKEKPATSSSERRTLEWAFAEGKARVDALAACLSKHLKPGSHLDSDRRKVDVDTCNPKRFLETNEYFSHVAKSVYVLQLRRWIDLFGQDNVKVVFLEEMAVDPVDALSDVFEFVGMDLLDGEREAGAKGLPSREEWEGIVRRSHNRTDEKKKKILDPQVTPELLQSMRDYFAPFNAELQELLGRPLPENWSLPPGSRV